MIKANDKTRVLIITNALHPSSIAPMRATTFAPTRVTGHGTFMRYHLNTGGYADFERYPYLNTPEHVEQGQSETAQDEDSGPTPSGGWLLKALSASSAPTK
jgi:hypothetical protein